MPGQAQHHESIPPWESSEGVVRAVVLTLIHIVLWAGLFLILVWIVPRCVSTLEEFDVVLPAISLIVIEISLICARFWYLLAFLAIVGIVFDFGLLLMLGRNRRKGQFIAGLLLALVPLLLGSIVLWAIWMPTIELQRQLN